MAAESELWATTKSHLSQHLRMIRIESSVTPGLPDVYYRRGRASGWIELKALRAWPLHAYTPLVIHHYTGKQVAWARAEVAAGGLVWLFLRVAETYLLLDTSTACALWERQLTRADLRAAAAVVSEGAFPTTPLLRALLHQGGGHSG